MQPDIDISPLPRQRRRIRITALLRTGAGGLRLWSIRSQALPPLSRKR